MARLGGRFGLGVTNCRDAASVVSAVRDAESFGAEIAFMAEDIGCRDAFELCAVSAGATNSIRIGTGVVNPYTRAPTALAMAIATLDELSAGRAVLGLGTSSPSLISEQLGIDRGRPLRVMREATEIIRALLQGSPVSFTGERFIYANARLEVRPVQERIPVYFAAMGPRMLRLAGEIADGVLLNVGATVDYVRWAVAEIRAGAFAAGRDPGDVTVAAWLTAYVTSDLEQAMQRAREWLAAMLSIPEQGELLLRHAGVDASVLANIRQLVTAYPHGGDRAAAAEHIPDEAARLMTLIGDADEVLRRIGEYRAAGVELPVLSSQALRALA